MASVWDYVADLARITRWNEDPKSDFYKNLGGQAITDGPGSDNIPVICTAVAIARAQQLGDLKALNSHLDRVERYLALPWMDREPGSRNAYSELITEGVECYYAAATKARRNTLALAAKSWLDATYTAVALGAYPGVPDGEWTGPYITLTGARSGASRKGGPDDKRWYDDGVPRPPWFFEDHPLSNRLGVLLGAPPFAFVKDLYEGYKRLFGVDVRAAFGPEFRKMCRDLVGGQWNAMALTALRGIPGPRIPFSFLRASNGAATIAHTAIQYGSTSMMYALAAWDKAPSGAINDLARRWGMPHLTMLLLDNPKWREQPTDGRAAHASLHHQSNGEYKVVGIRQDKQAYDEHKNDMVHRPDGKSMPLPSKDPRWLVLWNKDGAVEVLNGDGPPPPPPPPDKIDMLEVMAPRGANFTKVNNQGTGRIATIRDDENRVFVVVKGAHGTSWDWFYWDDDYIYHVITEGGEKGDPTAFKSHVPPGVIWCKRFATLGESHVSSRLIWLWANCEQVSQHSLQAAKTTLHDSSYTAAQLGMESDDLPGSTVCYRINWQWGDGIDHLETFTYAVGWGFLDWEYAPYPTLPKNQRSTKPVPEAEFFCFDVPQWIDENFRPSPPPPPPPHGWHSVVVNKAHLKFTNSTAQAALSSINGGSNHVSVSQVALLPEDLAVLTSALRRIVDAQ